MYYTRDWYELTAVEQLCCDYSDFHKEVYGFRARLPVDISEADAKAAFAELAKAAKIEFARRDEEELQAIVKFEALVTKTIANGARTREIALRWIMDASDCNGDWDFLSYNHGIPFDYFKKVA